MPTGVYTPQAVVGAPVPLTKQKWFYPAIGAALVAIIVIVFVIASSGGKTTTQTSNTAGTGASTSGTNGGEVKSAVPEDVWNAAYTSIIDDYKAYKANGFRNAKAAIKESFLVRFEGADESMAGAGINIPDIELSSATKDLNKDGIPELIIGGKTGSMKSPAIFDIYTFAQGQCSLTLSKVFGRDEVEIYSDGSLSDAFAQMGVTYEIGYSLPPGASKMKRDYGLASGDNFDLGLPGSNEADTSYFKNIASFQTSWNDPGVVKITGSQFDALTRTKQDPVTLDWKPLSDWKASSSSSADPNAVAGSSSGGSTSGKTATVVLYSDKPIDSFLKTQSGTTYYFVNFISSKSRSDAEKKADEVARHFGEPVIVDNSSRFPGMNGGWYIATMVCSETFSQETFYNSATGNGYSCTKRQSIDSNAGSDPLPLAYFQGE